MRWGTTRKMWIKWKSSKLWKQLNILAKVQHKWHFFLNLQTYLQLDQNLSKIIF